MATLLQEKTTSRPTRAMGAPVEGHPPSRFVVSRRTAGVGDLLINLVAAWRFAEGTGRTLVADWRGSRHLQDREQNLFPALFEPVIHDKMRPS